jgi:hypothetical protein
MSNELLNELVEHARRLLMPEQVDVSTQFDVSFSVSTEEADMSNESAVETFIIELLADHGINVADIDVRAVK